MSGFRVARLADRDIDQAWDYIAEKNPQAAKDWLASLDKKFALLSEQPLMGEACPQVRANLRRFTSDQYVIYYRYDDAGIEIIRVLHGARDVKSVFGEG